MSPVILSILLAASFLLGAVSALAGVLLGARLSASPASPAPSLLPSSPEAPVEEEEADEDEEPSLAASFSL